MEQLILNAVSIDGGERDAIFNYHWLGRKNIVKLKITGLKEYFFKQTISVSLLF